MNAIILSAAIGSALSEDAPKIYSFREGKTCTMLVDLESQKADLERLDRDSRVVAIGKDLIRAFRTDETNKCNGADDVRAMAVYIPGVDNYGRPQFGSRINILRLDGPAEVFSKIEPAELHTPADIERLFKVQVY